MKEQVIRPADPIFSMLEEINKKLERLGRTDDEPWRADEIADYMKLSKKTVQNDILTDRTFPKPTFLPTGGRRWTAGEVKAWYKKRRP